MLASKYADTCVDICIGRGWCCPAGKRSVVKFWRGRSGEQLVIVCPFFSSFDDCLNAVTGLTASVPTDKKYMEIRHHMAL